MMTARRIVVMSSSTAKNLAQIRKIITQRTKTIELLFTNQYKWGRCLIIELDGRGKVSTAEEKVRSGFGPGR
jgi:hypothetical protein